MTRRTLDNASKTRGRYTTDATAPGAELTWPADRFFWGTLDAPGLRRPGALPPALALAFADTVPVPIEELHTVMAPVDGSASIVVCAARRTDLEPLLTTASSLTPASLPGFIDLRGAGSGSLPLNLLVGGFEPIATRQRRHRLVSRAAMIWIALMAIAIFGFMRRASLSNEHAQWYRDARNESVEAALPGGTAMELRDAVGRLERQVEARRAADRPNDVSGVLAAILRGWPLNAGGDAPPEIQSIALNERRMAISVLVRGDPSPLLAQLKAPDGWTLKEPRLTSVGDSTRLLLELVPVASKEAGQ